MRVEFLRLEDGQTIELFDVTDMMIGGKYYWLSFEHADGYRLPTDKFRLWTIEEERKG